jgi:putative sterol carrier protein
MLKIKHDSGGVALIECKITVSLKKITEWVMEKEAGDWFKLITGEFLRCV